MRRFWNAVFWILIVAFIIVVLAVLGLYKSGYHPIGEDILDVEQGSWAGEDPAPGDGKGLKILFVNLNHGLGRETIWYEQKSPVETVHDAQEISGRLDEVVNLVRDQGAIALVLQEVDFGSKATGGGHVWPRCHIQNPNPMSQTPGHHKSAPNWPKIICKSYTLGRPAGVAGPKS